MNVKIQINRMNVVKSNDNGEIEKKKSVLNNYEEFF